MARCVHKVLRKEHQNALDYRGRFIRVVGLGTCHRLHHVRVHSRIAGVSDRVCVDPNYPGKKPCSLGVDSLERVLMFVRS